MQAASLYAAVAMEKAVSALAHPITPHHGSACLLRRQLMRHVAQLLGQDVSSLRGRRHAYLHLPAKAQGQNTVLVFPGQA